ncbi:MAG: phenylalanine--tRNA ligase subunit alpha [Elusimicrobia bacterium]|nr:phenylalanine--tRNA ligase subunit alpha [Elusimicrobiota bacterium]
MNSAEWKEKLLSIRKGFFDSAVKSNASNINAFETEYLGRKGFLTLLLRDLKDFSLEEKKLLGHLGNTLKSEIANKLSELKNKFGSVSSPSGIKNDFDLTLPAYPYSKGSLHPITQTINKITEIFLKLGFSVAEGPFIENEYYNFEALNIPEDHSSRDMHDTFYSDIKDSKNKDLLLRTHTSPVQIRTMEKLKPPLRIISPGRVFRRDAIDASHSFVFYQIEGFYVDRNVSMADLKWTLETFIKELFGEKAKLRFRPSYFPFVEPGAEVDMSCVFCPPIGNDKKGKCPVCKDTGWIEVLGAGVIHPKVLKSCGYDSDKWSGFAFGAGIERFAMLLFGIKDMRVLYENDLRILKQL